MPELLRKRGKTAWLTSIIAFNLLMQIGLSYKLWGAGSRAFPLTPAIAFLDFSDWDFLNYPLLGSLIGSLLLLIWQPHRQRSYWLFFSLAIVLILQDINRLQPWFYQMSLLLFIIAYARKHRIFMQQLLCGALIATYFWSGFHKFNVYFVEDVFPWFFEPLQLEQYLNRHPSLAFVGALVELLLAIGLLFRKSRRYSFFALLFFHGLILALLGPLGHNWNNVVWPWNLTMMGLLYLLFYQETVPWTNFGVQAKKIPLSLVFVFLFGLAPALNTLGYWDDPLSFKMYAGTHPEGSIFFYKKGLDCFPNLVKKDIFGKDRKRLVLDKWCFRELQVAPYNAPRVLKRTGQKICACLADPERSHFEILTVGAWNKKDQRYETKSCLELLKK